MKYCFLFLILFITSACIREDAPVRVGPLNLAFSEIQKDLEVNGEVKLSIFLSQAQPSAQNVQLRIGGTAIEGEDYAAIPRTLLIPAQVTEVALNIVSLENDNDKIGKTIEVEILRPENGLVRPEAAICTVTFIITHTVNLSIWAKDLAFPQLFGYSSGSIAPVPDGGGQNANPHFSFAYKSKTNQNVIGMLNNTNPTSSTNALNMHRLYANFNVSSASANIRIPEMIRFIPNFEGATEGTVEIIPQRVRITRMPSSALPPFEVGISGEGTYSEATGIIEAVVYFDETEIGGEENIPRRYVFEKEPR